MPVTSSTTLMASTSLAASGAGKRTVNLTSARACGVGLGPVGGCEEGAPGVLGNGHFKRVSAHAWLINASRVIHRKIRCRKTERDLISLLNAFIATVTIRSFQARNAIPLNRFLPGRKVSLSPG